MAKTKNKKRGFVHAQHLTRVTASAGIGILLFGGVFYSYAATPPRTKPLSKAPTTITHHPLTSKSTKPRSTTPSTSPKPTPTPTPTPVSTPTTTPTPTPKPVVQQPTPQVVVPSPSSSVDGLTPSSGQTPGSGQTQTTAPPSGNSPILPATSYSSTNWSGYLSAGGFYTAISASWIAPTVATNVTTESGDATWIGIGGVTSADLIQIGTENIVEPNGQVYAGAFYELLPDVSQPVPGVTITGGDSITASITQVSATKWTMTLTNNTTSQSYTTTVTYTSSNSSAEWVQEDPSYASGGLVPFDNFGTVAFSNATTTVNGAAMNLTTAQSSIITMLANPGHVVVAQPSAIGGDNASFSVTRKNAN